MILGTDKQKLSKRRQAAAVGQFDEMGYLPHALVNYLVRLGWSHGDQETFTLQEMIDAFSTEALNKTAAVFDPAKLEWLNAHYIKTSGLPELVTRMQPFWARAGLDTSGKSQAWLEGVVKTLQERATTLVQLAASSRFYFDVELAYDEAATAKFLTPENREMLGELARRLEALADWNEAALEPLFKELAAERGAKLGAIIQPTRVAVTGSSASPGMYEVLALLGRELSLARLALAGKAV
jgi:glutamyl-tRNA synthetase